jgi:hypothetical protein
MEGNEMNIRREKMDKIIWGDEIERIIADYYGINEDEVSLHIVDGCRVVAIFPDYIREGDK